MKASELASGLNELIHRQGDLDVLVEVVSETQMFALGADIDCDRIDPDGPHFFVLTTEGHEL